MEDATTALLDAARAGDEEAFASLARAWFVPLYDFAARVAGDEATGVEVAEETLVRAMDAITVAPPAQRLRGWLFGLAWQIAFGPNAPVHPSWLRPALDPARLPGATGQGSLHALEKELGDALASFSPRHRAILDLHLRHGLDAAGLVGVLRVSPRSAAAVAARLTENLEHRLAPAAGVTAADALAAAAPVALAPGIEDEVMDALMARWPQRAVPPPRRARVTTGPVLRVTPRPAVTRVAPPLITAAGILALALLLPFSPIALTRTSKPEAGHPVGIDSAGSGSPVATATRRPIAVPGAGTAGSTPSPRPSATGGLATATATVVPGATPRTTTPDQTATATTAASATASPAPSPTPTAQPSPTATQPPATPTATTCVPALSTGEVKFITILPDTSSFFELHNSFCGPADYSVEVSGEWLELTSPARGSLIGGAHTEIRLFAHTPAEPGEYKATVHITGPGGQSLDVTVVSTRPE
jgi:hypothetical protein